jgi:CheY-like chemotaxis protein
MIANVILSEYGLSVEIASDGAEAVDMIKDAPDGYYDLVLMDIQMPNLDGYEATKQIRSLDDKVKACIPIVAVTANAFEDDRKAALEVGMNAHLAKPYDIQAIVETLRMLMTDQQ